MFQWGCQNSTLLSSAGKLEKKYPKTKILDFYSGVGNTALLLTSCVPWTKKSNSLCLCFLICQMNFIIFISWVSPESEIKYRIYISLDVAGHRTYLIYIPFYLLFFLLFFHLVRVFLCSVSSLSFPLLAGKLSPKLFWIPEQFLLFGLGFCIF